MTECQSAEIEAIRAASRVIVRRLGFLEKTLAGTKLPPSAVHAIVELGQGAASTATDLTNLLGLEKSTVSRLIKGLNNKGLVMAKPSETDTRQMNLELTREGLATFRSITAFGQEQVRSTLQGLSAQSRRDVRQGLGAYANALLSMEEPVENQQEHQIDIAPGYVPGVVGRVTALHARYYAENYGFGAVFERKVATEMSEFLSRMDHPDNEIWTAMQGGQIVGSVSIDGQDLGSNIAHLRWFIVDDTVRGAGVGKRLMDASMQFVDERQFSETHLWTFKGLEAARCLYEREGFSLTEENPGEQWGTRVLEQKFVRLLKRTT